MNRKLADVVASRLQLAVQSISIEIGSASSNAYAIRSPSNLSLRAFGTRTQKFLVYFMYPGPVSAVPWK